MAFVSSLSVSSTSSLLSSLKSFLTSTLSWTLVDTVVSGIDENFVARSLGASGDRNILLKFGVSTASRASLSCWAADGFASATDVTSNRTTERLLPVNSGASITVWFEGDSDHVFVGTNKPVATGVPVWLYGGLTQEFTPTISGTPNLTVLLNSLDIGADASGRVVETPTATFDGALRTDSFLQTIVGKSDPNLSDGLVYLWPVVVVANASDRLLGTLRNAYAVGPAIVQNTVLTASSQDYTVFPSQAVGGVSNNGVAVKMV